MSHGGGVNSKPSWIPQLIIASWCLFTLVFIGSVFLPDMVGKAYAKDDDQLEPNVEQISFTDGLTEWMKSL